VQDDHRGAAPSSSRMPETETIMKTKYRLLMSPLIKSGSFFNELFRVHECPIETVSVDH
jgi:hypothetical protein